MASIVADEHTVARLLAARDVPLSVAAVNAPQSVVVSGEIEAVHEFLRLLADEEIVGKKLARLPRVSLVTDGPHTRRAGGSGQ